MHVESRWHLVALAGIIGVGAALRFTALGEGIPFSLGIDEPEIMERAVNMMKTGDLHPHFFDYPGLTIYLHLAVACLRFLTGAIGGEWANLSQAPTAEFYLWGRAVTAMLGTATIGLVYLAGRRLSPLAGLLGAALFAVQSMHVRESHFVLTDVPMTFFVTLAWVLTLHAASTMRRADWIRAGIAVGAAAATKYNGGVALLLPMLALLLTHGAWRPRFMAVVWASIAAAATFLICAPYSVLALPEFLDAFAYLAHMYAEGPPRPEPAWLAYLKHLRINFSIPGLVLAVAGLGLTVRAIVLAPRTTRTAAWVLSAAFTLTYYWMVSGQRLVWGRYLLPLLPFLCVLAGGAAASLASAAGRRWPSRLVPVGVTLLLLTVAAARPVGNAVGFLSTAAKVGTTELAYRWMMEHLPAGSTLATETREVLLPHDRYTIIYPTRLMLHDFQYYQDNRVDYLIASSASFGAAFYGSTPDERARAAYSELFRRAELMTTFMPDADHPGPELRVYRMPSPE